MGKVRWIALLAGLGALLFGGVAAAGTLLPEVRLAKHREGPYQDDFIKLKLEKGQQKSAYARVTNPNKFKLSITFTSPIDQPDPGDIRVRWFKGRKDITKQVRRGDYEFGLGAGKHRVFHAEVKANRKVAACARPTFDYTDGGGGAVDSFIAINTDLCAL